MLLLDFPGGLVLEAGGGRTTSVGVKGGIDFGGRLGAGRLDSGDDLNLPRRTVARFGVFVNWLIYLVTD